MPAALASAWAASESFVVLPHPLSLSPAVLERLLGACPPDMDHGHFGLLTSGSTGEPKLVIGERSRAERLAQCIHQAQALSCVRSTVLALPLSYSYAFVNQWLWSRVRGVPLVPTRGFADPASFFAAMDESPDSMVCLVGSQVPLLRRLVPTGHTFDQVVRLNFAGGTFPQHDLPWLHKLFPNATMFNNYGCTEALPRLAVRAASKSTDAACIGWPLPGVELDADETGALRFRSDYGAVAVVTGAGPHRFEPGEWIPTGDLGKRAADGWALIGRASEVFKRHGEKVSLVTLLHVVREAWPGSAALFPEVDPQGEPGCVLVLAPEPTAADARTVLLALRNRFRRPHWPLRVEGTSEIPLLSSGKPDVQRLRQEGGRAVLWRQIG